MDVDAVLFWKVIDPKKAALGVADYRSAISWASQTALRDVIGKTMLSTCWKAATKSARCCRRSLTNAPNHGASMSFPWR